MFTFSTMNVIGGRYPGTVFANSCTVRDGVGGMVVDFDVALFNV